MKPYVAVTGTIFLLITIAHVWRMFAEHSREMREPVFILLTLLSAGLTIWSAMLLTRRTSRSV